MADELRLAIQISHRRDHSMSCFDLAEVLMDEYDNDVSAPMVRKWWNSETFRRSRQRRAQQNRRGGCQRGRREVHRLRQAAHRRLQAQTLSAQGSCGAKAAANRSWTHNDPTRFGSGWSSLPCSVPRMSSQQEEHRRPRKICRRRRKSHAGGMELHVYY